MIDLPKGWPTHQQLYRFARTLTSCHHDAEALSSAAITEGLEERRRGGRVSRRWLYSVTRYRWIDEQRRAPRALSEPLDELPNDLPVLTTDQADEASEIAARREAVELVLGSLKTLPDDQRGVLELYFFQDKSDAQVARSFGRSESWARNQRNRGIEQLKARLTQPDGQLPAALIAVAEAARHFEAAAKAALHGSGTTARVAARAAIPAWSGAASLLARLAIVLALLLGLGTILVGALERDAPREDSAVLAGFSRSEAEPAAELHTATSVGPRVQAESDAAAPIPMIPLGAAQDVRPQPAAAHGERTFEIQLIVNGAPADGTWRAMSPSLDVNVYEHVGIFPPTPKGHTTSPDGHGVYRYELVDAAAPWVFLFRDGQWNCEIYVIDWGPDETRRVVRVDLSSIHVPKDAAAKLGICRAESIALVQLDDSSWVYSIPTPVVAKKFLPPPGAELAMHEGTTTPDEVGGDVALGDFVFERVAVGSAAVSRAMAESYTYYPDSWTRADAVILEVVKGERARLDLD